MNDDLAQEVTAYADIAAAEIWEETEPDRVTDPPANWLEFWDGVVDRVESNSWSPYHGMHINHMYDLIELRLLTRYLKGKEGT